MDDLKDNMNLILKFLKELKHKDDLEKEKMNQIIKEKERKERKEREEMERLNQIKKKLKEMNSYILKTKDEFILIDNKLKSILNKDDINYKLIYRLTTHETYKFRDKGRKGSHVVKYCHYVPIEFTERCKGINGVLVIAKNIDDYRFGGFTMTSLDKNYEFSYNDDL